jgi:predicted DNA-binding protein (MmcQ/YjbR family)
MVTVCSSNAARIASMSFSPIRSACLVAIETSLRRPVKAEPEYGRLLQGQHASITPGRYLDKRHWISLGAGPGITRDLVAELVDHSYHLVLETVPRNRRPD